MLSFAESVVCVYEYPKNSYVGFYFAKKDFATATKSRKIMPKVGVYSFNGKCIAFVVNISSVATKKVYCKITLKTVGEIFFEYRNAVDHALDGC